MKCYCKSGKDFDNCCGYVIQNGATTALELMKSRYSAYCISNMEYIQKTTTSNKLDTLDLLFLKDWSKNSIWQHLEIINNTTQDNSAIVEFKAYYIYDKIQRVHHEISTFIKTNNIWYYDDGILKNTNPKVGRNDDCICGSEKKYKKCCAKYLS